MLARIVIFAKYPTPGRVKTRLAATMGAEVATAAYRKLLAHTLGQAKASGLPVEVRYSGASESEFRALIGKDVALMDQGEGDLGARLARVAAPALIIGSDCPGLSAALLREGAEALASESAVIGPASDGGYWLIGFNTPMPFLFSDMTWSTDSVLAETRSRLEAHGIRPALLPELGDIDTESDLAAWPDFMP